MADLTRAEILKQKIEIKKRQIYLRENLPHVHGWKWYPWARQFFESKNRKNLLVAANQISKSSTQIRKSIHWATEDSLWADLWNHPPSQFWYFYPTSGQVEIEFEEKWKLFLPRGEFKLSKKYGWKEERKSGELFAIHFNSGVSIYFKTYSKKSSALQSGTVDAIFADEEMPLTLLDELMFRLTATNGYFHMVFTATLGQEFWRRAMDPAPGETEVWPEAYKQQVSMYDCLYYDDFTPSFWTVDRIKEVENNCKDEHEVARRVHGKFVLSKEGLVYESFNIKQHVKEKHPLPKSWLVFSGVDVGSGGDANHPAAIVFVGVNPNYQEARVFLAWRGDGVTTTSGDVLERYKAMKHQYSLKPVMESFDWAAVDFGIMAGRANEGFVKAEKNHELGEGVLNTLFKKNMMYIYQDEETAKLTQEFMNLRKNVNKRRAKDDLIDALRYAVSRIPWDWDAVTKDEAAKVIAPDPLTPLEQQFRDRRGLSDEDADKKYLEEINEEFAEWNDLYG